MGSNKRKILVVPVIVIYPHLVNAVFICLPCHNAESVIEATVQI